MLYSMAMLEVEDVARWQEHFHSDESRAARKAAGEKSWQLFHVAGDANALALLNEWEDEGKATAFLESEELRGYQQASGVVGTPQIFVFNKVESGSS